MPRKDREKRNEYMRNYYLIHPEKRELHKKYCKALRAGLKNAQNTV